MARPVIAKADPPVPGSGPVDEPRGFPQRWLLVLLGLLATAGVIAAVAGPVAPAIFQTMIYLVLIVPILVSAWALGVLITEPFARRGCFEGSPFPWVYRSLMATALGLGVFSLGVLLMGTLHLVEPGAAARRAGSPWPLLALPLGGLIAGAASARRFLATLHRGRMAARAHRGDWLLLAAAVPTAMLLIAATFPAGTLWHTEARGYDVLEYHLELPREYALNNSTAPLAHNVYSFLPANVEMLYLLVMQWTKGILGSGDPAVDYALAVFPAQFLHAILMLMAAAAVALMPIRQCEQIDGTTIRKAWLGATGRAVAVLLFLGIPWTLVTGSLAYNEAGMLLFGTLALGAAWGGTPADTEPRKGRLAAAGLLAGLLLGLAMGCKMTAGVFFALPVAALFLVRAVTDTAHLRPLLLAVVAALAVYSPWATRAAAGSGGNPVFPVASSVFPRDVSRWSQEQADRFARGHAAPAGMSTLERLGVLAEQSVYDGQWSLQPYRLLHIGEHWEPEAWRMRVGILWLAVPLVIGCAFIARRGRGEAGVVLAILGIQVAAWMWATHLQARFLLPVAVPLALLAGRGVQGLADRREAIRVAGLRILGGTIITVHALCTVFVLLPEAGLLGGPVAINGRTSTPPVGEPFAALYNVTAEATGNENARPEKVLLVGDARAWCSVGEVDYATTFDRQGFMENLADPAKEREYLRRRGIRYVLINTAEVQRLASTYGFEGVAEGSPERAAEGVQKMLTQVKALEGAGILAELVHEGIILLRVPE